MSLKTSLIVIHFKLLIAIDASFFGCYVFMVGRACSKYSGLTGNGEGHEDPLSYTRRHIASCKRSQKDTRLVK